MSTAMERKADSREQQDEHKKEARTSCVPDWLSVDSLHSALIVLRDINLSQLTVIDFINTVQRIKSDLFALELFQDMILTIPCGLTADYNGYSLTDDDKEGYSGNRLVRDVFATLKRERRRA